MSFINGYLKSSKILGIIIGLAGSILDSLGLNIQKLSFRSSSSSSSSISISISSRGAVTKKYIWLSGFLIYVISAILTLVALCFISQSSLAPLNSISLVSNALFAHFINKEEFKKKDFIGLIFSIIGSSFVLLVAKGQTIPDISSHDLHRLFSRKEVVILLICLGFLLLPTIIFILVKEIKFLRRNKKCDYIIVDRNSKSDIEILRSQKRNTSKLYDEIDPSNEDMNESCDEESLLRRESKDNLRLSLTMKDQEKKTSPRLISILFPFIAGTLGATSSLLCRVMMGMVRGFFQGNPNPSEQFYSWRFYLILLSSLTIISLELVLFNIGLSRYNVKVQIPIFNITTTILNVIYGIVFWSDNDILSITEKWLFFSGILCACLGTYILSS